VTSLLPELAAAVEPDIIVAQDGAVSHVWDPLAHLRNTVTALGAAAGLVHDLAHEHATGRWLATGGGGYDAYRVVPRSWSLVWLAAAHRDVPAETPAAWRERWAVEGRRYGQAPLPLTFEDPATPTEAAAARSIERTVERVRSSVLPLLEVLGGRS
jgi:acetoin utilization protein AcuC